MLLIVDNYDSFVYNLDRYLVELGQRTRVVRNDAISRSELRSLSASGELSAVVISPGPCDPGRAGVSVELVRELGGRVPILGVCLGHQAIAHAFGARVSRSGHPRHGVSSLVHHDGRGVFTDLPSPLAMARYHSLVVERGSLPACLEVSAVTRDLWGETVMAIRHREHLIVGLQFHPESILSQSGHEILANFLELAGLRTRRDGAREPSARITELRVP